MEKTVVRPKGFVNFTVIAHSPGNPKRDHFIRSKNIAEFGEVAAEYGQLGAGAVLVDQKGDAMYTLESLEELSERIAQAEKESE